MVRRTVEVLDGAEDQSADLGGVAAMLGHQARRFCDFVEPTEGGANRLGGRGRPFETIMPIADAERLRSVAREMDELVVVEILAEAGEMVQLEPQKKPLDGKSFSAWVVARGKRAVRVGPQDANSETKTMREFWKRVADNKRREEERPKVT